MSTDLMSSAPRTGAARPRTVVDAVRLMYTGAVLELATLITILATTGSVRTAVLHSHPAAWHLTLIHIHADEIGAPIVIALWLWMAWANGRGYDWARLVFAALFGLITLSLVSALAGHGLTYARADVIVGAATWLAALAALVLIFSKPSNPYYRRETAQR